jgi:hypothetical protein
MKGYKEKGFADRLDTAAKAKQDLLKKFGQRSSADDPAQLEKRAARMETVKARAARAAKREEEKEAEKARMAAEEALRAAAKEHELQLAREREVVLEKERKAARDARYAARKAR